MPTGSELILGFGHPKFYGVIEELGLVIDEEEIDIGPDDVIKTINSHLEKAWLDCLRNDLKLVLRRAKVQYRPDYIAPAQWYVCKTDEAKNADENLPFSGKPGDKLEDHFQAAQPFGLGFYYDPDEIGDRIEDAIFGISLITRYYPCFLDLDKPHGGSGDVIRFNKETNQKIEIARTAIIKYFPQWAEAEAIVKELFY